jgi:hypothetical protein
MTQNYEVLVNGIQVRSEWISDPTQSDNAYTRVSGVAGAVSNALEAVKVKAEITAEITLRDEMDDGTPVERTTHYIYQAASGMMIEV